MEFMRAMKVIQHSIIKSVKVWKTKDGVMANIYTNENVEIITVNARNYIELLIYFKQKGIEIL